MYRDDLCAVCGESLPPDHLYCREHAAEVDDRLHEIGTLLERMRTDLPRLAALLEGIAEETYDWLAEDEPEDPEWPPADEVALRLDPEDLEVDVDTEPGYVRVILRPPLAALLAQTAAVLSSGEAERFARACAEAEGANATH
jgi:hypothetical protein